MTSSNQNWFMQKKIRTNSKVQNLHSHKTSPILSIHDLIKTRKTFLLINLQHINSDPALMSITPSEASHFPFELLNE